MLWKTLRRGKYPLRSAPTRSRCCVRPLAFQPSDAYLAKEAAAFPMPFPPHLDESHRLSPSLRFRPSFYESLEEKEGVDSYIQSVTSFSRAYKAMSPLGSGKLFAVSEHDRSAFVMFFTEVKSTMSETTTIVSGVYVLSFDLEGAVVSVCCHRSPTAEERASTIFSNTPVSGEHLNPLPCTWPIDNRYTSQIRTVAGHWMDDVCSKVSIQSIYKMASPDFKYHDGSGLKTLRSPINGIPAFIAHMTDESSKFDLGIRTIKVSAIESNKVLLHWGQPIVCRDTQKLSILEGVSVLIFDSSCQVSQVIEFLTPSSRDGICAPSRVMLDSSPAASQSMWDAETELALTRQSQEWESF